MMLMMLLMNDGYSGSEEGADLSQQEARFDQVTERYLKSICLSGINFTAQPDDNDCSVSFPQAGVYNHVESPVKMAAIKLTAIVQPHILVCC